MATLTGTNGSDTLTGGVNGDLIQGLDGNDNLFGGAGVDTLEGGAGVDILNGGPGDDRLDGGDGFDFASYVDAASGVNVDLGQRGLGQNTGGAGIDTLLAVEGAVGSAFNDVLQAAIDGSDLYGAGGADALYGRDGDDFLFGGEGDDWLSTAYGDDELYGGAGNDSLVVVRIAAGDSFLLDGEAGNDSFIIDGGGAPNAFSVYALGGDGNDLFTLGNGNFLLSGGTGSDLFKISSDYFTLQTPIFFYIEDFQAGSSGDRIDLSGLSGVSNWHWWNSNPFTDGYARVRQVDGGVLLEFDYNGGGDSFVGLFALEGVQASNLRAYNFSGHDPMIVVDNGGDDVLISGSGADTLDGGAGNDTADYSSAASYVTVDLRYSTAQNTDGGGQDTLVSIENVIGSAYDDRLWGNGVNNTLYGMGGDDQLDGGLGNDTLDGGSGFDTANYGSATSYVTIDLDYGSVQNTDAAGLDTFASIERVIGGNYDDRFWGSDANNFLHGGIGQDQLNGRGGEDLLDGGANHDILTGGAGPDVFVFRSTSDTHWDAPDRITDFAPGDRIDIGDIDADTTVGGNQAFHIATQPEAAGVYISYDAGSNRTTLRLDTDGDGNPDGRIWLDGDHRGLTNADFVL